MTGLVKYGTPHPERSCTLWRVTGTLCTPSPSTTLMGNSTAPAHLITYHSEWLTLNLFFPPCGVEKSPSLSLSAGLGHCRVTGVVLTMGPFVTLSNNRSPCPFLLSFSAPFLTHCLLFSLSETRLPQAPLTRPANCGVLKRESVSTRLEGTQQKSYVCILTSHCIKHCFLPAFTLVSAV